MFILKLIIVWLWTRVLLNGFRMDKVQTILEDYLDDYNMSSSKEMKLVFFQDAIGHLSRWSSLN